jgi:hypothetical protein
VGLGDGGVGTLLIGIAKVKEAFGHGAGEPPPRADPPATPDAPKYSGPKRLADRERNRLRL